MIDLDDSQLVLLPDLESYCQVLIVDDDELVARRIAMLLEGCGYRTHVATTAEAALQILEGTPCQIVLTDWHMPDMDGLALCRKLRSKRNDSYIYILLLTVRGGRSDVVSGLAAGADDYVVKGATPEELLARVGVGRRITSLDRSLRMSNHENRRISETDALTGLRNRRFLMKYLPRELDRARHRARPLALLCCDIDHFKKVNDDFGHEVGDEILQEFSRRAAGCIRPEIDWIARSGGEEFVIVLPETDLAEARGVALRLRQELSAYALPTRAGPLVITVSTGVSALETVQELGEATVVDLLRAADRGLYASKKLGRDRATTMAVRCEPAGSSSTIGSAP